MRCQFCKKRSLQQSRSLHVPYFVQSTDLMRASHKRNVGPGGWVHFLKKHNQKNERGQTNTDMLLRKPHHSSYVPYYFSYICSILHQSTLVYAPCNSLYNQGKCYEGQIARVGFLPTGLTNALLYRRSSASRHCGKRQQTLHLQEL